MFSQGGSGPIKTAEPLVIQPALTADTELLQIVGQRLGPEDDRAWTVPVESKSTRV